MMEDAALARRKEAERQANIKAAMAKIEDAFAGKQTATANKKVDWSKVVMPRYGGRQELEFNKTTPEGLPAGYTIQGNGSNAWTILGPNGKPVNWGAPITYSVPTGPRSGGFDDAFYEKYKNAMLTNYRPQVAKQFGEATDETLFRLARAGTTESSAAKSAYTDLDYQNRVNNADVAAKADAGKADLKKTIAAQKDNAILQANTVNDPNIAVNSALTASRDLHLSDPGKAILGDVFKVAEIGAGSAISGYQSASNAARVAELMKKNGSNNVYS
jgi:hypothetical protein